MKKYWILLLPALFVGVVACVSSDGKPDTTQPSEINDAKGLQFRGAFSNGMKGDSIFFTVSPDGKKLSDLTFKGYWRCSGSLEQTLTGPEGTFDIVNGRANGHLSEPPNGGSTAWRYDIDATISGKKASGTFRMNINNLGCDTYLLKFTATAR